jgi:ATP-dependent DNA helicase RecG
MQPKKKPMALGFRGLKTRHARREAEFYLPTPAITYHPGDLWMEFQFPSAYLKAREVPIETPEKIGEKTREKTREKIPRFMREEPGVTAEGAAARLPLTRKGVEWQVRKLKAGGAIRRVGPDKGGHWEVLP